MISSSDCKDLPASLSIIIPAYNEETRILPTLQRLADWSSLHQFTFLEVIVVNDGSRDDTAGVVKAFAAEYPQFRLVENPGNKGKGYAIKNGMLQAKGDWRLFSDADLSAPIEEIVHLWAGIQRFRADIAIGSRALDRTLIEVHQSRFREIGGIVFNRIIRVLTGLPFSDTQCGFKLFSARAAEETFSRMTVDGFGFDAESLFIATLKNLRIVEVPVRWAHVEGTKMSLGADSTEMVMDLVRTRWNQVRGKYR